MEKIRYPVNRGTITQTFAEHIEWAKQHPGIAYNGGIDFYSDDRNVFACADGTVDKVGFDPSGYGHFIKLRHADFYSLYAHLLGQPVHKEGQTVCCGEILGLMGYSGNVRPAGPAGTHLHFETRRPDQVPFDPADFLIDSPAEQSKPAEPSTGWAEIVCEDGANMRTLPAGSLKSWLPKGVRVHLTGNSSVANNLTWFEIVGGYWVARADSEGTVLIEDIYE